MFLGTYWDALEVELDLDQLCRFSVQNRHHITGLLINFGLSTLGVYWDEVRASF